LSLKRKLLFNRVSKQRKFSFRVGCLGKLSVKVVTGQKELYTTAWQLATRSNSNLQWCKSNYTRLRDNWQLNWTIWKKEKRWK